MGPGGLACVQKGGSGGEARQVLGKSQLGSNGGGSDTNLASGFSGCNEGPRAVGFELVKRETVLSGMFTQRKPQKGELGL